jgi:hypothetical protein
MKRVSIGAVLNSLLLASLGGPCALGTVACGSAGTTPVAGGNGDAGVPPDAEQGTPDAAATGDYDACSTVPSSACNCPNAGQPFTYTLSLEGDSTACGLSSAADNASALCARLCGGCLADTLNPTGSACQLTTLDGGQAVQCRATCPLAGRRPPGLAPWTDDVRADAGPCAAGRHFALAAGLEAASVDAFHILRRELTAHGAPKRLRRAAERAAHDEIRHAKAASVLARRYGAVPHRPRVAKRRLRSLEALAVDNAVEGCVRETFGALLAMWQARKAGDPSVRAALARIAPDEVRHAALSWRIAAWLEAKVGAAGRRRVENAKRAAVDALRTEVAREPDPDLLRVAGLPCAAAALGLLSQLDKALWSAEGAALVLGGATA